MLQRNANVESNETVCGDRILQYLGRKEGELFWWGVVGRELTIKLPGDNW